eukprot:464277_1
MKQIVNKIPSETRRLYQFWCENVDAVEFYEVNDMDSLLAYVRETYPFPNTLQPVLNKIKNIVQRWRERPITVYHKLVASFQLYNDYAAIINEGEDNVNAHIEILRDRKKLKIMLKCFVEDNNRSEFNNRFNN